MVAFVWSEVAPVGIDIEPVMQLFDEGMAKMVLSDHEYADLEHAEDRQMAFIRLWTMKEAVAKAVGRGINMDFRKLDVSNNEVVTGSSRWQVRCYSPSIGHIASLATDACSGDTLRGHATLDSEGLARMFG